MDYIVGGKNKIYMRIKKIKNLNTGKINADVSRISCRDYDDPNKNKNIGRIIPQVTKEYTIIPG